MNESKKILVVDDDEKNVKLLSTLLRLEHYKVLEASSGPEALHLIKTNHIDLMLLDVMMPEMNGFELTQKLRQQKETRLLPIVLVTALKDAENRVKGIKAGCDDFISKPFDKVEILARVQALLKMNFYRSQIDEKQKFETIINHIKDGIVILDQHLKVIYMNEWAKKRLMLKSDDADFDLILHLKNNFIVKEESLLHRIGNESISFDLLRPATDTSKAIYLLFDSVIVRDPEENIENIVIVITDVTEERHEEKIKQNFLNLISHKLRTPGMVINTGLSLLYKELAAKLNDDEKKILSSLHNKSYELNNLIEKLIGFVTIDEENIVGNPKAIQLKEYLPKIIQLFVETYKSKKIQVDFNCAAHTKIYMNPIYLDLIIGDLLDNAIKFNQQDVIQIAISVKADDQRIHILISDNGIGIPPEETENVFKKFYQVEKVFSGAVKGLGLGLALVQKIVQAHGGDITLTSEINKGTTFSISLPVIKGKGN